MHESKDIGDGSHGLQAVVGPDILAMVTSGLYTNPLAVYREYIQNAVDAIAKSADPDNGRIDISINPVHRQLKIRDNGPGLTLSQAKRDLIPISLSLKQLGDNRGFRGIGRLCGLAFSQSITFLTRKSEAAPLTRVHWDGNNLREAISKRLSVVKTLSHCVVVETLPGDSYPANFFEVQVNGVSRYASGALLNQDAVRNYIGEHCPVPFNQSFPYSDCVDRLFATGDEPFNVAVHLDGEDSLIARRHEDRLFLSNNVVDPLTEFEAIDIPLADGSGSAAVGWIAHSSYLGAIPQKTGVRCLRARQGNIQIGSEDVFDHLFTETRFNRWCVGEVHILDTGILPDSRRDYFEPSPRLRHLENHLSALCRNLEKRCRDASKKRNVYRRAQMFVEDVKATIELASSGYLGRTASQRLVDNKMDEINSFRLQCKSQDRFEISIGQLDTLETTLSSFREIKKLPVLQGVKPDEVPAYETAFQVISEMVSSPTDAREIIEAVLARAKG